MIGVNKSRENARQADRCSGQSSLEASCAPRASVSISADYIGGSSVELVLALALALTA